MAPRSSCFSASMYSPSSPPGSGAARCSRGWGGGGDDDTHVQ